MKKRLITKTSKIKFKPFDNYGNVITNITKKIFLNVQKNRSFTILARNIKITNIYKSTYKSIPDRHIR